MTDSSQNPTFDTSQQAVGVVYAKALLRAAEASGNTERVLEELDSLLNDILAKQPQFEATLSSPRIPHAEKERILNKAFQGRMCDELLNFLKVASRHGRLDCVRAVGAAARQLHNEAIGRHEVIVRTAEPLSDKDREQVTKQLETALQGQVILHEEVNPDLIGGIVIRIGDKVFDGSVANQLERLREVTLARTRQNMREATDRFVTQDLNIEN